MRHSEHKPKGGDSANGGPKETENTALGGEWTPGTGASDCHDSPIAIIPPIADQANNKVLETSPDSEKGTLMPRPDTRSPSPLKWGACAQAESLGPTGFAPEDPSRGQLQESRAEPERPGLHAAGLLSGIKNLNIKKILKNINKVDEGSAGVRRTCTPRKKAADDEIERLSAITSIIDYMDLGHENPEKVMEKLEELTKVARGYLFIMVRRGWIEVYHVIDETEASPEGRLRLWRDREFSCHIEIETVTLSKLSSVIDQRGLARGALPLKAKLRADPRASVVHLYEYNEKANKHYLRKLAIVPAALPEEVSEPPPLDPSEVSQDNPRRQIILDEWRRSAAAHQNSDFYQLNVLCDKAERLDRDIRSAYDNLLSALPSFSRASSSIHRDFSHLPTARLKEVVGRIPLVIGKFLDQVREQTGLVVSRSDVKLTSSFFEYLHSDAEPSLLMSASKSGRPAASNNDFGSQGLGLEYPTPLGINPCLCGTYYVLTNRRKSV